MQSINFNNSSMVPLDSSICPKNQLFLENKTFFSMPEYEIPVVELTPIALSYLSTIPFSLLTDDPKGYGASLLLSSLYLDMYENERLSMPRMEVIIKAIGKIFKMKAWMSGAECVHTNHKCMDSAIEGGLGVLLDSYSPYVAQNTYLIPKVGNDLLQYLFKGCKNDIQYSN